MPNNAFKLATKQSDEAILIFTGASQHNQQSVIHDE